MSKLSTYISRHRFVRRGLISSMVGGVIMLALPLSASADTLSPVISSVSVNQSDITVNWVLNVADATSVDVILYDNTGTVVQDDSLSPSVTTDTFSGVSNNTGYYVVVTATNTSGTVSSTPSSTVDVVADSAPVITDVSCSAGNVTVSWTSFAPTATGYEVVLYDANGNVVADHLVSASALSDTFLNVPDAQGYSIYVTAHTAAGDLTSNSSSTFDLLGGSLSFDQPASINVVSCTSGTITVTWSPNATDATGYNVILRDSNGNIVENDVVDASAGSWTFTTSVADGLYSIDIVTHTPIGDFVATSWGINVLNGSLTNIPIDPIPVPVIGTGYGTVVDPSTVTVVQNADGTWTVSWPEISSASTDGYYLVTTDQGNACSVSSTGVSASIVSCTLASFSDPNATPSNLIVTYEPHVIFEAFGAKAGGTITAENIAVDYRATHHVVVTPKVHHTTPTLALVATPISSQQGPWIDTAAIAALVLAIAMIMRRLSRRVTL